MEHIAPVIVVGGIRFDLSAILMILVTCIIVLILAGLGARKASVHNPGKMQNFMEWVVEFVQGIVASTMDLKKGKVYITLGLTLIMFIFVGNMLGLPFAIVTEHHHPFTIFGYPVAGATAEDFAAASAKAAEKGREFHGIGVLWWRSPTADAAMTMGLAVIVILLSHYLGLVRNTKHYLKHYVEPHWGFLPLNLIKESSKLLTLGLRLFGNIYAGEVMISVILLLGWVGIPALLVWQGFSIFVGAIQAFIFTMLTMVYISQTSIHEEH